MEMNMSETVRLILSLRDKGWSEKEINDFMIYIGSGVKPEDEQNKE